MNEANKSAKSEAPKRTFVRRFGRVMELSAIAAAGIGARVRAQKRAEKLADYQENPSFLTLAGRAKTERDLSELSAALESAHGMSTGTRRRVLRAIEHRRAAITSATKLDAER